MMKTLEEEGLVAKDMRQAREAQFSTLRDRVGPD